MKNWVRRHIFWKKSFIGLGKSARQQVLRFFKYLGSVVILMEFPTLIGSDWREVEPFCHSFDPLERMKGNIILITF